MDSTVDSSIPVRSVEELEAVVLGGGEETIFASKTTGDSADASDSDSDAPEEVSSRQPEPVRKAVWTDEDDKEQITIPKHHRFNNLILSTDNEDHKLNTQDYRVRLKRQFEKTQLAQPKWARLDRKKKRRGSESSDSDLEEAERELTQTTGQYVAKSAALPANALAYKKLRDPTWGHRIRKPINTEFHRQMPVLMVSGQTQKVVLFKIDGESNPLLQSVAFNQFPIDVAHFSADGERVVVGSRLQSYFYYYDLLEGKAVKIPTIKGMEQSKIEDFVLSSDGRFMAVKGDFGVIQIMSAKSFEWLGSLKLSSNISAMCFSQADPSLLYVHTESAQIYVFDVVDRTIYHKFTDFGCVRGSSIAISNDSNYLACGSNTGVVNLYDHSSVLSSAEPRPLKSIPNLTTVADSVRFNGTGELLAIGSSLKENALKLVHVGSQSVLFNFPGRQERLKLISSVDFSKNGAYLSSGNSQGQATLFRLHHYGAY